MGRLNLKKKLKNCPEGTKLYSTIYGVVEFIKVDEGESLPITLKAVSKTSDKSWYVKYSSEGMYSVGFNGECTLFPDKNQRDWSKFRAPIPDKALIWFWDNNFKSQRVLGFYDKKYNTAFDVSGIRNGSQYDNYELFEGDEPEWVEKAREMLDD